MWPFFRNCRRQTWLSTPLAPQQRETLEEQVTVYSRLSSELRSRFEDCVKILAAERTFEGCEGIIVTADMKLTIAGHVATMLLGAGDFYFKSVTSTLIYPHVIERRRDRMVTQADACFSIPTAQPIAPSSSRSRARLILERRTYWPLNTPNCSNY